MLRTERADAQTAAGPRAFTECVAASLYDIRGKDLNDGQSPGKTVKLPVGWSPVGGTVVGAGTATTPAVVLCR